MHATRSIEHVAVIDIQRNINALAAMQLVEVAGVILGLCEALHVDKLVHGGAIPNAASIGLAVQRDEQPPDDGNPIVVEVTVTMAAREVWRRTGIDDFPIFELAFEVRTLDVKLPTATPLDTALLPSVGIVKLYSIVFLYTEP